MTTVKDFARIQREPGGSCSTAGLRPLNNQILSLLLPVVSDELVSCAGQVNIVGGSTIPLLQPAALAALALAVAEKGQKPNLVHAYRTVAQQVVLFDWGNHHKCSITLVANPGHSPHEMAIGIDIQEHTKWRTVLENHHWRWRGPTDKAHFTFIGPGIGTRIIKEGIRAFQRLWNQHNPDDRIAEDGNFGQVETAPRLLKSPVEGF
jgi:hypothetical protein